MLKAKIHTTPNLLYKLTAVVVAVVVARVVVALAVVATAVVVVSLRDVGNQF